MHGQGLFGQGQVGQGLMGQGRLSLGVAARLVIEWVFTPCFPRAVWLSLEPINCVEGWEPQLFDSEAEPRSGEETARSQLLHAALAEVQLPFKSV